MTTLAGLETGAVTLALGAGLLAAVNPCGFALLPAYLSLFVLDNAPTSRRRAVWRALRATAGLTAGFVAVFAAFGLLVAPVAASVQQLLPGVTVLVGIVLAAAGVWVVVGRHLFTVRLPGRLGRVPLVSTGWRSMVGFGAGYAVASLGCTIAPFLAVVVSALRVGSPVEGVVLFVAYAAAMGAVVGVAAVAVALARGGLVTATRRFGRLVPRLAGLVLAIAGLYVAWYGLWELRVLHAGAGTDPVVAAAAQIQQSAADRVAAVGFVGFVVALAGISAWAILVRRRPRV